MSDNVGYTPGSGAEIAADNVAGVLVQRVKATFGTDGVATDISASDPLPVAGEVTVAGTVPVSAAALPLPAGAATEATLATLAGAVFAEDTASTPGDRGVVQLGVRRDTDGSSVGTDGDYEALQINSVGRLKVSAQPSLAPLTTGTITANGQTVPVNVARQSNLMAHMVATALSNSNVTFEGSIDSTNGTDGAWFAIQAVRSNANTIELTTGNLSATPGYGWELSVNGLSWARVRATAHTSGTATWKFQPAPYATEPIPAAQVSGTQPVSGSVTATLAAATVRAGFIAAAGIWYDDSSTNLAGAATFTGTSRDATVTVTATAMANAATYAMEVRLMAESDVTGTLWLEASRDNAAWRRVRSVATAAITGGGFAAEIIYRPAWRYWRCGYTNGAGAQGRFVIGSITTAN